MQLRYHFSAGSQEKQENVTAANTNAFVALNVVNFYY